MRLPPAVLLDFDGTLLDSKPFNAAISQANWAKATENGQETTSVIPMSQVMPIYAHLATPMPGAEALMQFLEQKEIPFGICSNNHRQIIEAWTEHLSWNIRCFATPDDGYPPKPMPDLYLAGLQKLEIEASLRREVWVIEDSKTGLRAAKASGTIPVFVGDDDHSEAVRSMGVKFQFRNLSQLVEHLEGGAK